jgi:hypothetical protein
LAFGQRVISGAVFSRRLVTGLVLGYGVVSLMLGGTSPAKPIYYAFAIGWLAVLGTGTLFSRPKLRWGWLRWLDLTAGNLALTVALAEAALRIYAGLAGASPLLTETLDTYRLVPGRDYGAGLCGNSLGYPGPEFTKAKRPGVFRIAALGDSFAVGPAVPFGDNYLTLVEQALPGVEVYNFGVAGTGPREYHAILRQDVWTFDPDLVLVSIFVGNDITETMGTPRHLDPRQNYLYLLLTRAWRLAQEKERQAASPARVSGWQRLTPALSLESFREVEARRLDVCFETSPPGLEKKWCQALKHLDHIVADCRQRGVPLVFVLIPDEFQVNPAILEDALRRRHMDRRGLDLERPQRRLAAFCAERGVPCLDLLDAFQKTPDTYAAHDTHWNVRGNRLAAELIAARLAKVH